MRSASLADGESASKLFQPSHYHTTGHTRDIFEGGNYHHCSRSSPTCQNTEGWEVASCDEIRPEMLEALKRGVLWLICVSNG